MTFIARLRWRWSTLASVVVVSLMPGTSPSTVDRRLRHALSLISDSLADRTLTVSRIAAAVQLSPSRLGQLMREHMGMTPKQLIARERLLLARRLIRSSFLPLKDIIVAAGIADPSHFSRDYKRAFNRTPSTDRHNDD
jgi:transcriptional regulator GlxA family with amidase domain